SDAALDGITGHQVQVGEVGDQLQYRTHFDVLEIERQLFTGIAEGISPAVLNLALGQRLDADYQTVVGLVHQMFVETGALAIDDRILTRGAGIDEVHRRGEVLHIQAHAQLIRQLGSGEIEADAAALLLHIDADARIGEVDDAVAFSLVATVEVRATDGTPSGHIYRAGYRRLLGTAPVTRTGLSRPG